MAIFRIEKYIETTIFHENRFPDLRSREIAIQGKFVFLNIRRECDLLLDGVILYWTSLHQRTSAC